MNIQRRIEAFSKLGEVIEYALVDMSENPGKKGSSNFEMAVKKAAAENAWFTEDNINYSLISISNILKSDKLNTWINKYEPGISQERKNINIGVIMAGNVPAVGFHDMLCVLVSGNSILIKTSSDDNHLIRLISSLLLEIEPGFKDHIRFTDDKLKGYDAIIATGSNNTSRYFEYYFRNHPHIIRRNMNGVALLTGDETVEDIDGLGEDVFRYFGLGCRNVASVLVPRSFDLTRLTQGFNKWEYLSDHNKYHNNYTYYKTLALLNGDTFYDGGFYIMKNSEQISSPLSVVHMIPYDDIKTAREFISSKLDTIQCVVSIEENLEKGVKPGQSQHPELWDYADDVDTMEFLISL